MPSRRCYLCGRFMLRNLKQEECPSCIERMEAPSAFLDGPRFVAWLENQGIKGKIVNEVMGGYKDRRFSDWRVGTSVKLETADEYLVAFGLNISDLPDDIFRADKRKRYREEIRAEARLRYKRGQTRPHIAKALEVNITTLNRWLDPGKRARTVWGHVEKRGDDECWKWKGHVRGQGRYPKPYFGNRAAQRMILEEEGEIISSGQVVRTRCGDPLCCNPKHFIVCSNGEWAKGYTIWGSQGTAGISE